MCERKAPAGGNSNNFWSSTQSGSGYHNNENVNNGNQNSNNDTNNNYVAFQVL